MTLAASRQQLAELLLQIQGELRIPKRKHFAKRVLDRSESHLSNFLNGKHMLSAEVIENVARVAPQHAERRSVRCGRRSCPGRTRAPSAMRA